MAVGKNPQKKSAHYKHMVTFFRSATFRELFAQVMEECLPEEVHIEFVNDSGKKPLPFKSILKLEDDGKLLVDISRATNTIIAAGMMGRIEVNRLVPVVRHALEAIKERRSLFNQQDLSDQLRSYEAIPSSESESHKQKVDQGVLELLEDTHKMGVLVRFLEESEKNKIRFMSLIYRYGITIEYDKHLPLLSDWLNEKIQEQQSKIELEVDACDDDGSMNTTVRMIRKGIEEGTYLGNYMFLRKKELLGFLKMIEPRERDKIGKIKVFNDIIERLRELIQSADESKDTRNSEMLEFVRLERDLANLVPSLKGQAVLVLVETLCKIIDKVISWKSDSCDTFVECLEYSGYLNEGYKFIEDMEKLLNDIKSSPRFAEKGKNFNSAFKRVLHLFYESKHSFYKIVVLEIQPALEEFVQKNIVEKPFEKITNTRLAWETLISHTQSIENKKPLFSEGFYINILHKFDQAAQTLKTEIVRFAKQQIERLQAIPGLTSPKVLRKKLSESVKNIELAQDIINNLTNKNISVDLFHVLYGAYLPEDILKLQQKINNLQTNVVGLSSTIKEKEYLLHAVTDYFVNKINPGQRLFTVCPSQSKQGMNILLTSKSDKSNKFSIKIDWVSFQPKNSALFSVQGTIFRSHRWIIRVLYAGKGKNHKKKSITRKTLKSLPGLINRCIPKFSFVEAREPIESLESITDQKSEALFNDHILLVKWLETVIQETELLKPGRHVSDIVKTVSPLKFLEEMRAIGVAIDPVHMDAVKDYMARSSRVAADHLVQAIESNFAIGDHLFLPIQCSDESVPLQTLIGQWLEKASINAFEDIYSSFRGMIGFLSSGRDRSRQMFNVSAFSDSEQQLFELLRPISNLADGKIALIKMADLLDNDNSNPDLNYILNQVIRENLMSVDENLTAKIMKTLLSQYEKLRQKEYERNIFLQMEIAEAILETVTMFHERNVIIWNIKPAHILLLKKGKNPVLLSFIDFSNTATVKSGRLGKETIDETFSSCSIEGNEMYLHPYWFRPGRNKGGKLPLFRLADLHMTAATILELFIGKPLLGDSYARLLSKFIDEDEQSTFNLLMKEYYGQMNRNFERVRNHIGEFNWFQQLHRFITHSEDIIKKEGHHPLLDHAPHTPYFIKPGEKIKKIVHFYRKSDEALVELTQKQAERIISEWLKGLIRRLKPDYTLISTVSRRLRWNYKGNSLEIIYSIIHYNPGKSIIVGLRFTWSIRRGYYTIGNDDLILSIPLDFYRTISYSVITRGLVDAKLRNQFIHFMSIESSFSQKVTELKDIIVSSCPVVYIDILSRSLAIDLENEKSLINKILREKRGFLGIIDVLKNIFVINIDGRDYLIQPYKFLEGQTLEAWIRKDEYLALERDMLRDVLEIFIDRTIPWCELTSPENWSRELQGLEPADWEKLRIFFDQFNFHKLGKLLKEEKLEQEKLLDEVLGSVWDISDPETVISFEGLSMKHEKQRLLAAYLLERKEEKKRSDEELADKNRKFANDIALVKLAMFYHICHENRVIHRDIKPANIMIKPLDNPASLFVDVKVIDTEGTLWKEGRDIKGFYPEALISITPDYSSPYILQWLLEQSSEGYRYFELLQEYDAFSLFIIFYELLRGRNELREIENGIYDEYCLKISTLIRNPFFMGYIYAKNEKDVSYDFSYVEFIDKFNFDELIINLKNDFAIECEENLDAINECLKSIDLYHHLRTAISEDELNELDVVIGSGDLTEEVFIKKHNRFLMAKLYHQVCPTPPETKQSLLNRYKDQILDVTRHLVDAQELFETLLLRMYSNLSDDQVKYTLYHWFLRPAGINQKLDFKRPEDNSYGELQYRWFKSDVHPKKYVFVERTPSKIKILKKMMRKSSVKVESHDGRRITDPIPLSPLRAFLLLGKIFIIDYRGLVSAEGENGDEPLLYGGNYSSE